MRGVYVHIPYCARRCIYCAFVSGAPHDTMRQYVDALKREISAKIEGEISTVYIGGGTPSVLFRGGISEIISCIRSCASVRGDAEITVECNPDSVTPEFVSEILSAGVNRVSIGLQTDNDKLLRFLNRPHDKAGFLRAYDLLGEIPNKSVDLMLGIPGQTKDDLMSSLNMVTALNVPHISLYALKSEVGTPLYDSGFCEDDDFEAELYDMAYKFLTERGYERYEVSNFCLDGKISRHNFSYWDMTEYYGFGVAAHSYLGGKRIANTDNIYKYILGEEPHSENSDVAEEYIMLGLRTNRGISLGRLKGYGVDLMATKKDKIDEFIRSGFLIMDGDNLKLSDGAFYVMNSVICELI